MDFRLTADQEELRQRAKAFAEDVVLPGAADRDRTREFPADVVKAAAEQGYLGCLIPAEYGGMGVGNLGQCLILEEIAAACASTHVTISVHNSLVCGPVLKYGTADQKDRYLPRLASGELLGAYLLTEATSGSDAAAMKTTAVEDGDDFILNGEKMWITTGDKADVGIIFARSEPPDVRNSGAITAFIVDLASEGVSFGKQEQKLGLRASSTVSVSMENVRVSRDNLLGEKRRGFRLAMDTLYGGRIGIAVQSIGIGRAAVEAATRAVAEVECDGRALSERQSVQFRLATMATRVEASRLMAWKAAFLRDHDEVHITESSMAKLLASTAANTVCREAVALLGESGYDDRYVVERLMRDVRVTELYEGTTEIQKLVIAKQLMGQ